MALEALDSQTLPFDGDRRYRAVPDALEIHVDESSDDGNSRFMIVGSVLTARGSRIAAEIQAIRKNQDGELGWKFVTKRNVGEVRASYYRVLQTYTVSHVVSVLGVGLREV